VAGYSGKPLVDKLGLKPGMKARLIGAVYKPPAGVEAAAAPPLDFIHLFAKDRAELEREFSILARGLAPSGMLWVSWPKGASKVKTDLGEAVVREVGLRAGLVDVKVCAVDEVWSGLKFVIRLKNR
jgi:hypothetical protein